MSTISVESSRFGTVEVDAADVIEFPTGLIGLGGRRYTLLTADEQGTFRWLQSLDDPAVALPVTTPWQFFADYAVELSDADSERIGADESAIAVWVTVRTGAELPDFSANLRAPIVVAHGRGYQVINEAPDTDVRAPLFAGALAGQAA
jgi:flagellar assembly factor FliW